jgi:hypothetical protein
LYIFKTEKESKTENKNVGSRVYRTLQMETTNTEILESIAKCILGLRREKGDIDIVTY